MIVIGSDVKFSVANDVPEKNIEYDNNTMRGFKWGDNSCAYDCALTTLWIAYTTDNKEQKEMLKTILPDFETCFEGMNISTDSYAPTKKTILDTYFFCPNSNFRRLEFQSIDHVRVCHYNTDLNQFLRSRTAC